MSMAEKVTAFIPSSLDDIVRKNREKLEIRLAIDEELADLNGEVPEGTPRGHITLCRIVKFNYLIDPEKSFYVALGFNDFEPWITSDVVAISENRLKTKNSVYTFEITQTEPTGGLLYHVCYALNAWGISARLDLDIPRFFY